MNADSALVVLLLVSLMTPEASVFPARFTTSNRTGP